MSCNIVCWLPPQWFLVGLRGIDKSFHFQMTDCMTKNHAFEDEAEDDANAKMVLYISLYFVRILEWRVLN